MMSQGQKEVEKHFIVPDNVTFKEFIFRDYLSFFKHDGVYAVDTIFKNGLHTQR